MLVRKQKSTHMWLIIIVFGSVFNGVVSLYGGKLITNEDDYSFIYAILRLQNEYNETELKTVKRWDYQCVATAVSQNQAITAAHCLGEYWNADPKESLNTYYIIPGRERLNLKNIEGASPIDVNDVKFHANFRNETCPTHDVAIITLSNNNLARKWIPLCLHQHDELVAISLTNARFNNTYPHIMNYGSFKVDTPDKCVGSVKYIKNNDTQLCTTSPTCSSESGDSGSPLITTTQNPCLTGVLSCGNFNSTVFCNVVHNDWIKQIVRPPIKPIDQKKSASSISQLSPNSLAILFCSYFTISTFS